MFEFHLIGSWHQCYDAAPNLSVRVLNSLWQSNANGNALFGHRSLANADWGKIMRKRLTSERQSVSDQAWLNLGTAVTFELTSEDDAHPIEAALSSRGWRATGPGEQTIRLIFDEPQRVRRINLVFNEPEISRTQEFVLRWCSDADQGLREILRQQWNFSPPQTALEIEDYQVDLASLKILELVIVPDIGGGNAYASLESLRLA